MIIRLVGGLGNQLFGWALGRALETRGQAVQYEKALIDADCGRRYLLADLGLRLPIVELPARYRQLDECGLRFRPAILNLQSDGWVLSGYWQSEKYFAEIRDEIINSVFHGGFRLCSETFRLGDKLLGSRLDSCFIHVRRTDNLRQASTLYHGLTDAKNAPYYQRAIGIMRDRFPGVTFYIFSDDPEWCKANMTDTDMVCVTHNAPSFTVDESHNLHKTDNGREVEDLYLMSLCRHAIMANSTFSWWGAWLNRQQDGLVIAPDPWFSGEHNLDACDIIPERWMKVSTQ